MLRQSGPDSGSSQVLFIGGRSGVGNERGNEIHAQPSSAGVRHRVIDGDVLDMVFPAPSEHGVAERNLAAIWANYRALRHRRLIYVNTASVLADEMDRLTTAMGGRPRVSAVLLRRSAQIIRRLAQREVGSTLEQHLEVLQL